MGIFDKSNYIVNAGIIEQIFQCPAKAIRVGKDDSTVLNFRNPLSNLPLLT